MARSRRTQPQSAQLNTEDMKRAIPKIERRINDLKTFDVSTIRRRWDPMVKALEQKVDSTLQDILGHGTIEYNDYSVNSLDTLPLRMGGGTDPIASVHDGYREGIESAVMKLTTLKELFEERIADDAHTASASDQVSDYRAERSRRVFVVHGHDGGLKETVARYLERLELIPVILHEKPNQGRTIIEKFEGHSDVEYAVVLFTPDDIGYPVDKPDMAQPRARQNVVLELGYFMAALGRDRVCLLYKEGVDIPSDYAGVLYVELDGTGAWQLTIAREMKSVGLDIDLNKTI